MCSWDKKENRAAGSGMNLASKISLGESFLPNSLETKPDFQ